MPSKLLGCTKLHIKLAVSLCSFSHVSFPFNFRTANAFAWKFGTLSLCCLFCNAMLAICDIIPGAEVPCILCGSDFSWVAERERERRLWHRSISSWNRKWSCIKITSTARWRVAFWAWLSYWVTRYSGARVHSCDHWCKKAECRRLIHASM